MFFSHQMQNKGISLSGAGYAGIASVTIANLDGCIG
jgi:hypothetical protein